VWPIGRIHRAGDLDHEPRPVAPERAHGVLHGDASGVVAGALDEHQRRALLDLQQVRLVGARQHRLEVLDGARHAVPGRRQRIQK